MNAKQTPLIDLLNAVPKTARLLVEEDNFSTRCIAVGKLCADAAEEIEALRKAAALVAAAEREACATVCEDTDIVHFEHCMVLHDDAARTLRNAATAIRARGQE